MAMEPFKADQIHHAFLDRDVAQLISRIREESLASQPISFDLETTCLDENEAYARVSVATFTFRGGETWCLPLSHPQSPWRGRWQALLHEACEAFKRYDTALVGQNIVFDVRWCNAHTGVDLSEQIYTDTMLGSHLLNDLESTSLKPTAERVFGIPRWDDFDFKEIEREQASDPDIGRILCPRLSERVPYFQLAEYACADTYWTWRLFEYQGWKLKLDPRARQALESDPNITGDDLEVLRLGRYKNAIGDQAITSLAQMQMQGMLVNRDWCMARLEENERIIAELHEELCDAVLDPFALDFREASFNPNSNWFKAWTEEMIKQDYLRVVAMTAKGAVSWDAAALNRLVKLDYPVAATLADYRTRTTENQYLRVWLHTSQRTGRVHANFNFARTRTGRLSSSEPNLQQVSRVMKDAFWAPEGKLLVSADYSNIELRVAAHIADIKPIKEALWNGIDLHKLTASMVAGVPVEEVTKDQRQRAKAVNFGFLFGMGAPKFIEYAETTYNMDYTMEEAVLYRTGFYETWDGIAAWHEERREEVRETGQVVCPLGRIRRLPNGRSNKKWLRGEAERAAINTPVQSTASDMMLTAVNLIRWDHSDLIVPVAIVHDSVVAEVDERHAEEAGAIIKDIMERRALEYLKEKLGFEVSVPFTADIEISRSWGGAAA